MKSNAPGTKSRKSSGTRIPKFNNVEEEALFWDTHDTVDLEDEFEEVPDIEFVSVRTKRGVAVRLQPEALSNLTRMARREGVTPATLVRTWVLEKLAERQLKAKTRRRRVS